METLIVGLSAFGVSVVSPIALIPVLRRHKIIDVPGDRSSHSLPIIRGVGLAAALGVLAAWGMAAALDRAAASVATVFGAGLAVSLIGLVDDIRGLSVEARLIGQLAVGAGVGVTSVVLVNGSWWVIPVVAVGFAGYVNAANFMDGVDSMSAFHGVVAGGYFCLVGGLAGHLWLQIVGGVCAAVFAGFAPWNLAPRLRVFLGDVGSYLLGGLVVGCSALVVLGRLGLLVGLAPLLPYIADTTFTVIGRALRGERVTQAHRSHVYQRLTLYGCSHLAIGTVVALATALCCLAALLAFRGVIATAIAVAFVAIVLAAYLALPRLITIRGSTRTSV
jgi:UDP-N-acetylmuramyl pentapeptide phosphotransferase/UDP-N-acetylglucosamine-1-phosphate transferase